MNTKQGLRLAKEAAQAWSVDRAPSMGAALSYYTVFSIAPLLLIAIYMPHVRIEWRDVLLGAAVTALLFTAGKQGIGLYIGKSSVVSGFGAAGSLAVLLLWVYYSAQIFLLGAEFTHAHAHAHGSHAPAATVAQTVEPASIEEVAAAEPPMPMLSAATLPRHGRLPKRVQRNPLGSIGIVAVVGTALGLMLRVLRRRHQRHAHAPR